LSQVADWTGATYQDKRYTNKYSSQFGGGSQYAYFHEEDETSFQLVDTARTQKTAYQRNRMRFAQVGQEPAIRLSWGHYHWQPPAENATLCVLMKARFRGSSSLNGLAFCHRLGHRTSVPRGRACVRWSSWAASSYIKSQTATLIKANSIRVKELVCPGCQHHLEDCKAQSRGVVLESSQRKTTHARVRYHTNMNTQAPKGNQVTKAVKKLIKSDIFLNPKRLKRDWFLEFNISARHVNGSVLWVGDHAAAFADLLTVSETANEPPQDEGNSFNSPRNLAMEATYINHNFSQQCLRMGKERYNFPNPNPFVEDDMDKNEVASVAYRYRRWKLGDDIDLIVRCEHDGVMTGANGEVSFINIKTLPVYIQKHCNGVDWRQKLDSQRGAVIATELKNNSYKLARWTCCALLAGSEYLKLGYVSRYHVKDSSRHVILGTQQFKPNEFASQINL
uniref:Eukaryotic translation initiation factor 3 subunit D n=1 Tax=Mustela putorius furo TaxID=9669 RepID=M3YMD0_MUSPF